MTDQTDDTDTSDDTDDTADDTAGETMIDGFERVTPDDHHVDTTDTTDTGTDATDTDEWTGHYQFQAFCSCGDNEIEIPLEDALDWTREHMSMHEDRDPDNRHVEISISKRF